MKHISILVPKGAILGSIEGPRQVLTEANKYLQSIGKAPMFDVKLVGLAKETSVAGGRYSVHADILVSELSKTDLIIIPALDGDMMQLIDVNGDFISWIIQQHQQGAEVTSLCVGAFLLASTGLIDGKSCTTHWLAADNFKKMFPKVTLIEDKIITDEAGIYSSGGAFSYLNLILYLIEKYAGRDVAIFCAKAFQIDYERRSQSPFTIFNGQKEHEDKVVKEVQDFIESKIQEKITVEELADRFAISRRSLERRFKSATSNTIVEYIQRVKIEAAKKSLETSQKNINEIMYDVGYGDMKSFRTIFKKITGLPPVAYRNKYNKDAMVL